MKKKYILLLILPFVSYLLFAADIPQHISYTKIYDYIDELANEGYFEINSAIKPYSREFITKKLLEAKEKEKFMNRRQRQELYFYLNDYALEQNKLPDTKVPFVKNNNMSLALVQPAFHYRDSIFKCRITPILGAEFYYNKNDFISNRTIGIEFQGTIGKGLTFWGSLRDKAFRGELLSEPTYLTQLPGYEYKESEKEGADYSDSRGGIKYGWNWGSFGLVKDQVIWGDNYNGSNILSGRNPSIPMITLQLKPVKWFQLDYFHGWLVSNVVDSTNYYIEDEKKHYRNSNKYMAANMFTITPVKKLNVSFGNSIIYAERNVHAAYFIPIAFYKSLDHSLTKGIGTENQNSQMFLNISSRNIRQLHLYTSIFIDEFKFGRLKPSNKQANPISFKIGGRLSNCIVRNLSVTAEYTHTNIINYKHSVPALSYASNSFNMGHYLGDNAEEIYVAVGYKPIRGLDVSLSYVNAKHGNEYRYLRRDENNVVQISNIISQGFMKDVVWTNSTVALKALYEVFNNAYAGITLQYSNIKGKDPKSTAIKGEDRYDAQGYLDLYTPKFYQGETFTLNMMLSIGF
ncbi:hypothetical protein LJC11_03700 [Bacteroidales bacterium OttesenSCG-928-I21]|nr:hypothetical protein [Bacteroidales bacterium OttesenSCG-928-I21]